MKGIPLQNKNPVFKLDRRFAFSCEAPNCSLMSPKMIPNEYIHPSTTKLINLK